MPNEIGGRADKEGNKYEVMVVIYYLLKVFNEEEENVTWEPIGIEENGTDIITKNKEGNKKYIQCKNRNGSKEYWDIGTLNSNNILKNWESHLSRNEKNQVALFSPLAFTNLEDLIKRSKTNNNLIDFYVFQVMKSGKSLRDLFNNICEKFKIDTSKFDLENKTDKMIKGLNKIVNYLRRIDIITWTEQALKEYILSRIEQFFVGNKEQNYAILTGIVWSEDLFGKPINKIKLVEILKNNNIEFKNSALDDSTLEKIEKLNGFYDKVFSPINDNLFFRKEFNECKKFLEDENSIIIYGKSGIGKSGVTKYITDYCKKNNIVYIAIKLDKNVPKDNLELWSKDLGFKKSIVTCLDEIAGDNKGVIILDQLDALRWTSANSEKALYTCNEIISEVCNINKDRKSKNFSKICIVFCCRKYDLENDKNIKKFITNNKDMQFSNLQVNLLSDIEVQNIIGNEYLNLNSKLKELLRIPSNLYIFNQLDDKNIFKISTTQDLIKEWWEQIVKKGKVYNLSLNESKKLMVEKFEKSKKLYINEKLMGDYLDELKFLQSSNILYIQQSKVFFSHQSILDSFLAEDILYRYYDNESITSILGNIENQTPNKRYQLQMFLENMIYDTEDFIKVGKELLNCENIRYYNKYVFLEILSVLDENNIDDNIEKFIIEYSEDRTWGNIIIDNVIRKNINFYRTLKKANKLETWVIDKNKRDLVINLLIDISPKYDIYDINFIKKYFMDNQNDIDKIQECFKYEIIYDTDDFFKFRLEFIKNYYVPYLYLDFNKCFEKDEIRTVEYLICLADKNIDLDNIYIKNIDFRIKNPKEIIKKLINIIPNTNNIIREWKASINFNSLNRFCVELLKKCNSILIKNDYKEFLKIYKKFMNNGNYIFNELILEAFYEFPTNESDFIIKSLYDNFEKSIFDKTSNNKNQLELFKKVVQKHCLYCSNEIFNLFLDKTLKFLDKNAKEKYKSRIETNKEIKQININNTKQQYQLVYWSFWGNLQYEILSILPQDRLNEESIALKNVLCRKFKNDDVYYQNFFSYKYTVQSPINNKNLTDRSWLNILTNKKIITMESREQEKEKGIVIESSLRMFCDEFGKVVNNEPERFIKLILNNYNSDINDKYLEILFNNIYYNRNLKKIDINLLENLILRFIIYNNQEILINICKITSELDYKWKDEIVNELIFIILNKINYIDYEGNFKNLKELIESLYFSLISTILKALGNIISYNNNYIENIKDLVEKYINYKNNQIKISTLFILHKAINVDNEWAIEKILLLYEQNLILEGYYNTTKILYSLYDINPEKITNIIKQFYNSKDEFISRVGAFSISELYLLKDNFDNKIFDINNINKLQFENILNVFKAYFNDDKHNIRIKNFIFNFNLNNIELKEVLENFISNLFANELIIIKRDKDFLMNLINYKVNINLSYNFLEYINKNYEYFIYFKDLILSIIENYIENFKECSDKKYNIENNITQLTIYIYDRAVEENDTNLINKSLELWDNLFKYNIGNMKLLSNEILER